MDKRSILVAALILPCAAAAVVLAYLMKTLEETNAVAAAVIDGIGTVTYMILGIISIRKTIKTLDTYREILRDAFRNDKRSRKKLREAYMRYSKWNNHGALTLVNKLESFCAEGSDYAAVYMLRALCYGKLGKTDDAIRCCETVEQHGFIVPEAAKDAIFHSKTIAFKSKTDC